MRSLLQAVGWIWVVFNALAGLYGLAVEGANTKGLMVLTVAIVLASPGVLLIAWGRRHTSQDT